MYAPKWVLDTAKAISGDIVNTPDRGPSYSRIEAAWTSPRKS